MSILNKIKGWFLGTQPATTSIEEDASPVVVTESTSEAKQWPFPTAMPVEGAGVVEVKPAEVKPVPAKPKAKPAAMTAAKPKAKPAAKPKAQPKATAKPKAPAKPKAKPAAKPKASKKA